MDVVSKLVDVTMDFETRIFGRKRRVRAVDRVSLEVRRGRNIWTCR
jgi:ABC-type oligopeptide transport system ATPase subunit